MCFAHDGHASTHARCAHASWIEAAEERLAEASALDPLLASRVRFARGAAEAIPVGDATRDLVWCREVLVHVSALDLAFGVNANRGRSGRRRR
jgi:hypothetical protein